MTSGEGARAEALECAWQVVEQSWGEDAAHRHFIAFCAREGALAEAAKRYRAVAEGAPDRREQAERRLKAVLAAAFASLEVAQRAPKPRSRWLFVGCGVGLVLLGYVVLAVLRRFAR